MPWDITIHKFLKEIHKITMWAKKKPNLRVLVPFFVSFGHFFPNEMWKGACFKEGMYIRKNMVNKTQTIHYYI